MARPNYNSIYTGVTGSPGPLKSHMIAAGTASDDYTDSRAVFLGTKRQYDQLLAAGNADPSVRYDWPRDDQYIARDTAARTQVDGLGTLTTPDVGTETIVQGPAANLDVDNGMIHMLHSSATSGSDKSFIFNSVAQRDIEVGYALRGSALPTAGAFSFYTWLRYTDTANTYRMRVVAAPSINLTITGQKLTTALGTVDLRAADGLGFAFAATTWYRYRIQAIGSASPVTLRAKFWVEGQPEPSTWWSWTDSSAPITTISAFGIYSRASTGTTPMPWTQDVTDIYAIPYVFGVPL